MFIIIVILAFATVIGLFLSCVGIAVAQTQRQDRAEMREMEQQLRSALVRLRADEGPGR